MRLLGERHAHEHFGDILDVEWQGHAVAIGEVDGLVACRQHLALDVVHRTAHLVWTRDIRGPDAGDGHLERAVVPVGLMFVEGLRDRVDAGAKPQIRLVHRAVAVQTLRAIHSKRARVDHAPNAEHTGRFKAVIHAEDVQPHLGMGVTLRCAQGIREVKHAVRLAQRERLHDIVHEGDVATDDLNPVT